MQIYIVEDDAIIAQEIEKELRSWHYDIAFAERFDAIAEEIRKIDPQLVVLDIQLPYENGFYWCRQIRQFSNVPILFISSKSEEMDIIMAMQMGGDDYITKPINLNVLTAKIGALLRRTYHLNENMTALVFRDLKLFPEHLKIQKNDQQKKLTSTECIILTELFRAQGKVVSRENLMENCWQGDRYIDDNTLAVNMTRLRKKLRELGAPDLIDTVKGKGYALSDKMEGEQHEL